MTSTRAVTRRLNANGGGAITRTVLPGGMRVVTEAMPAVRSLSVGVWVPVGSRDESRGLAGTSHFLEHLLFKGTSTRSALDIASAMDAVGGEFNAFTEKEHTCYYATVLDRDLELAIDIISDVVQHAVITAQDVDIERSVVLEEIAMRDDDPSDLVFDEFATALHGDVPIGRPILGTVESITALTRPQVHGYYQRRYRPEDLVVSVAGNMAHGDVLRLIRRHFEPGSGDARPVRRGEDAAARPATAVRVVGDDTEQANVVLGMRGLSRHDPRRFAVGVLSAALGGGMSSRLFQRIREQRGLAYSVYSFTQAYADTGQFGVYAGCQPGKADEVFGLMSAELDAAAHGGLTDAEIDRGKGQMRGAIVLGLEDSGSRMTRIGKSELTYGEIMGLDELLAEVDAVTHDLVAEVAADLLARPRCLTVVGPFGDHDFDGAL
ncbi:MAG TPA: pitrilysin family protein [Jatrophihabitantaceae bacterium]|jgi:predicted Zn-dependent peptidase|nr:pitrilysin family protein [Jatrophihabitantaceae bacterium]